MWGAFSEPWGPVSSVPHPWTWCGCRHTGAETVSSSSLYFEHQALRVDLLSAVLFNQSLSGRRQPGQWGLGGRELCSQSYLCISPLTVAWKYIKAGKNE